MRLQQALGIYLLVTWLLLAAILVAGWLAAAGNAAGWAVAPLSMAFVLCLTFFGERCRCLAPEPTPGSAAAPAAQAERGDGGGQALLLEAGRPLSRLRFHWMDNAKVVLISLVVVGHSGTEFFGSGAFLGFAPTQANWFKPVAFCALALLKPLVVPCFFFISGFFSAHGRARKGAQVFLRASFWRLGPAYFLFWLVFNPLNSLFAYALARPPNAEFAYFPSSAATWFLSWLLVFQACYALVEEVPVMAAPPPFSKCVLGGLGVAVVQLAASLVCAFAGSTLGFGEMPMTGPGGDGFFNAVLFAGGVLARANDWLALPMPSSLVLPARLYVLGVSALILLFFFLTVAPHAPGGDLAMGVWTALFFALQIPLGPFCLCICVVAIDLFQRWCDFETGFTKFLAGGAFAVYLLQYWAVTGFTWLYIVWLGKEAGVPVQFVNSTQSTSNVGSAHLYLGFAFVAAASLATCFTVGGLLKMTPVLGDFL